MTAASSLGSFSRAAQSQLTEAEQKSAALQAQQAHRRSRPNSPTSLTAAYSQNSDSHRRAGTAPRRPPPSPLRAHVSITHKFGISGHEGYITVGLYPNGQLPAKSSSAWPRKAPPSPASWIQLRHGHLHVPPARRPPQAPGARSSPTPALSPQAGPATNRSATPSPSWTTSSAGCSYASSPATQLDLFAGMQKPRQHSSSPPW